MLKIRLFTLSVVLLMVVTTSWVIFIPPLVIAQDQDVGTPPVIITPGTPLNGFGATRVPTVAPTSCFAPLPLQHGDTIYIESNVNIRSQPSSSSPLVWNTSYNQVDEEGERLPLEENFNLEALVLAGPICANGFNWWQVDLNGGNDGWVAEGRPDVVGGYTLYTQLMQVELTCTPLFTFDIGEVATITQNVRLRADANTRARVKTVAPAGSDILILSAPQCDPRTGLVWFEVQVTVLDVLYRGWMSQGAGGAVWLIPTDLPNEAAGTLCGAPLDFTIGMRGYVNSFAETPHYLRQAPGYSGEILYLLVDGVPFEFIGGPTCVDNLNWWRIRVLSSIPVDGWIAEGSPYVGSWLSPIDPNEYAR